METGDAIIQEPVSTKTHVEESPAGVVLDHPSMEVDKANLSTVVLNDEITNQDISRIEADVVNGSGNKETEDIKTENDEQSSISVHETETKNSPEREEKKDTISKPLVDNNEPVKVDEGDIEKSLHSTHDEQIKTDEVKEEKDSITFETSTDGDSLEPKKLVLVEVEKEEVKKNVEVSVDETEKEKIVIETPIIQGEHIESIASLEDEAETYKSSKDTEVHEDVLEKSMPRSEILLTETEAVDTSTVQEATITKTPEAVYSLIVGEEEGQETKVDTKPSSDVQEQDFGVHTEPHSLETIEVKSQEVTLHQESEKGSYGLETKEETVSVAANKELGDKSHEPENEEVANDNQSLLEEKSGEGINVSSSALPSEEREGETVFETETIEDIKANEEENLAEKIQRSLETVETVDSTEPVKFKEDDMEEGENIHTAPEDAHQDENAEPVEARKAPDDVEKISHEVTGDREKEVDVTPKTEEIQENPMVIETPTKQEEDTESKASEDTEEHVLVRDTPQIETLLTESESVNTSTVQEAATPKAVETTINEPEAVHSTTIGGEEQVQETEKDTETSLDLKEDKESFEVKFEDTVQEMTEEKHEKLLDVPSTESDTYKDNEPETALVSSTESRESDLAVKVDKEEFQDDGSQTVLEPETQQTDRNRTDETEVSPVEKLVALPDLEPTEQVKKPSLESSADTQTTEEPEAEQTDPNRTEETEESPVEKLVALPDAVKDTAENIQKPSLESPSEITEETSKTIDEKIEEKAEVTPHQEGQEKGSFGLDTKEETVSIPVSLETEEKVQEIESSLPKEEENETKLQTEQIEKHELATEGVHSDQQSPAEDNSDEVLQVSSSSSLEEPTVEAVVEAEKIEEVEKIQRSLETVEIKEPHSSLPSSSEEQDHETDVEVKKTEDEKAMEAESTGDMSEKDLEIPETRDLSLPSGDLKEETIEFDEEIHIPSATLSLDEQENVTSTEKGETKERIEEPKQDKSQEISEDTKATESTGAQTLPIETLQVEQTPSSEFVQELDDQIPEEEHKLQAEEIPETTEETEAIIDETPKQVEAIHEDETKEPHKLQEEEEILPTNTVPIESFGEAPVSILASEEYESVTQPEEQPGSAEREEKASETKPKESDDPVETSSYSLSTERDIQEPVTKTTKVEDENTEEAPKLQELKEEKSKDIPETTETIEPTSDQTLSSELVSGLDDQTPRQVEQIHEEEHKFEGTSDQSPSLVSEKDDQTSKQVEEINEEVQAEETLPTETVPTESFSEAPVSALAFREEEPVTLQEGGDIQEERPVSAETEEKEEETKPKESEPKVAEKSDDQVASNITKIEDDVNEEQLEKPEAPKLEESKEDKIQEIPETIKETDDPTLLDETSQADQTLSSELVSGSDDQTPRQVEEIHEEETELEATSDQSLPVGTSQDQTSSFVEETHEKNQEAETREADNLQVEDDQTSKHVEESDEEETKGAHKLEAEEILHTESVSEAQVSMLASRGDEPVTLQEGHYAGDTPEEQPLSAETETKPKEPEATEDISPLREDNPDYPTGEVEHEYETSSTLPVVGILQGLHTTLETERAINDSALSGENIVTEPPEQVQKTGDTEVEINEKESAAEVNLQEEEKEEVKVQDDKGREFEVSVDQKLQEEEARETAEKQEDVNAPTEEKTILQEDEISNKVGESSEVPEGQPQPEIHETVSEDVQDEKAGGLSVRRDIEEVFPSEVKEDKNDVTELGVGHDFVLLQAEKEEEPQITDPEVIIKKAEYEANEEHVEAQAISDDTKSNEDKDFPIEQAPKDLLEEVNANQVEEISVVTLKEEAAKLIEDKGEAEYKKIELEDAIKHGVSEKETTSETIDREVAREVYQEESKQTDTTTAIKDEIREEEELSGGSKEIPAEKKIDETVLLQKEINQESSNSMKNIDDEIEKTKIKTREIEDFSFAVSKTQDISKREDEETENNKGLVSEVKETEPTVEEPPRNSLSLSDIIHKGQETKKTEDATTEPHIEEETPKTDEEGEDGDGDDHKDDKTSPDSIVMVEAKDTLSVVKTPHKGILSGVGAKVKHSIIKVKKALIGKSSSHTTKPSSPK